MTGLPVFTVTVTAAARGAVCRVGEAGPHPASEHYAYSRGGGDIDRCEAHGGQRMRDQLRARGHTVIDRLGGGPG